MPRNSRLRDYLMRRDERNPYGSRGGYITSRDPRRMRMDRGMGEDYTYDREMEDGRRRRNARGQYMSDRAYDGEDYGFHEEKGFKPVEAMGYFTGYYGGGQDMARGGRGRDRGYDMPDYGSDYNYDMNYDYARRGGRRDYGYDRGYDMRGRYDYGYDYAGDYGENLTKEELEHWRKKLDSEVGDEQAKNFFKKENIEQKARAMGIEMKGFNADELALASYMLYSDYCASMKPFVGSNMDVFIKMGKEFLVDPDSAVKGGEKLALYHEIVSGEND